ncbi:ATP-citrate synthase beta chain protein 2, partial [Tetrabaena socialis]
HVPAIKMIVVLGELGGRDEYGLVEAMKAGSVTKPVVAWVGGRKERRGWACGFLLGVESKASARAAYSGGCVGGGEEAAARGAPPCRDGNAGSAAATRVSGTCATLFKSEVQFGHAGARSGGDAESAQTQAIFYNWKEKPVQRMLDFDFVCGRETPSVAAVVQPGSSGGFQKLFFGKTEAKNAALRDAGAIVPDSFEGLEEAIRATYQRLVDSGVLVPAADVEAPAIPQDLAAAVAAGKVRVPTHIVSTICDDRGEEPTYYGVTMSELIEGDYGIGDVISLLWFKRKLPKYASKFIEVLNVDGCIGAIFLDLLAASGCFSEAEAAAIVEIGYLNALFVVARSIGLVGHALDQKRLQQPLYRHPWEDVLYTS